MELSTFLNENKLAYYGMWYFIDSETKKKTPLRHGRYGEKNTLNLEKIEEEKARDEYTFSNKPTVYYNHLTKMERDLDDDELITLKKAYTVFVKHTPNLYCIDIDDDTINSMDDFVEKTKIDMFKKSAWIKGNTKGIHIYVYVNNMPEYSNQQNAFKDFKGDFIRTCNMWERITKKVYNKKIREFEYEDIKNIFNGTINKANKIIEEIKNVKTKCQENKDKQVDEHKDIPNKLKTYIEVGIKHKIFEKMEGRKLWLSIGFIIKNELGDDGEDSFVNLSRHHIKFIEADVRAFYKQLNKTIKQETVKKPITILSLIKYMKDADKDLYNKIEIEVYKLTKQSTSNKMNPNQVSDVIFDESKLRRFDSGYMNSFKDDYATQRKYFELFVCKVMRPDPQFIYTEGDRDFGTRSCIFSENHIISAFKHIQTMIVKGNNVVSTSFTGEWLCDENMKVYNYLDFKPYNGSRQENENKEAFNIFTGYSPDIHFEYNKDNTEKILKPWTDLCLELCGGVETHMNYFIKFLAHMIQKPDEKMPFCFIIKGKQGTGKNMFLTPIGNIIGKEHYITSSNPKDFFGDYAEGFYHKVLVNMNECEGKDTFDFENKIKTFITEDTITINPKFVRPTTIRNVARVIIFTNKPNPIPIDVKSKDRRYIVFKTTDKFLDVKYGSKFWCGLMNHFNKPEFISCLYDYLNGINVENVNWRKERPITDAYKEMCKLYIPAEALFLEDFVNKYRQQENDICDDLDNPMTDPEEDERWGKEHNKTTKEVYDEYTQFCKKMGFTNDKTFQPSISKFNNRCVEMEIPFKTIKSNGLNRFRFTPKDIYAHLVKKKWIDNDESDDEIECIEENEGDDFVFEV